MLESHGVNVARYYFAPGYLKRYRPSGTPTINTNPHDGRQYGAGLTLLKVLLLLFEFNMGLPKVKRRNSLILFDRFIHDLLADPRRYRIERVRWWMRALLRFAPRPSLVVIITAPTRVIQARKQEVPPEETARQVAAYRQVSKMFPRAFEVNNIDAPEIAARHVLDEILNR
jgi:hypothetical protein